MRESWFTRQDALSSPTQSFLPPAPPAPPAPSLGWTLGLGFLGGGLGGTAVLFLAAEIARRFRSSPGLIREIGRAARLPGQDTFAATVVLAFVVGGGVGLVLGAMLRHARGFTARAFASILLSTATWTLVHAFVLKRFVPWLGALPFGPMVAGVVVYGLCVSLLRPPQPRAPELEG